MKKQSTKPNAAPETLAEKIAARMAAAPATVRHAQNFSRRRSPKIASI